jgi:para-nitrobenzyl esterase
MHDESPGGPPSAEAMGIAFAESVGIHGQDPSALAALRALPADQVVSGLNLGSVFGSSKAGFMGPVEDGQIVPGGSDDIYRSGRYPRLALMVGATDMDIGVPSGAQSMGQVFAPFGAADPGRLAHAYDPNGTGDAKLVSERVARDLLMIEPARFVAKTFSAQGRTTYEYRFSYVAEVARQKMPGAMHGSELPFVFDTLKSVYGNAVTPQDEAVARLMNAYWVSFAKRGDPNGEGRPVWPVFRAERDELLEFTAKGEAVGGPDPWKARLDLTEARSSHTAKAQ